MYVRKTLEIGGKDRLKIGWTGAQRSDKVGRGSFLTCQKTIILWELGRVLRKVLPQFGEHLAQIEPCFGQASHIIKARLERIVSLKVI